MLATWIFDPVRRLAWTADAEGRLVPALERLTVPDSPIEFMVDTVFTEYDNLRTGR